MTDLLTASKKAFRTLRDHQDDIAYILPLQAFVQLRQAITDEENRRAGLDTLHDDITSLLFHPSRIKSLTQADQIAEEIMALIASYLQYDTTEAIDDDSPTTNTTQGGNHANTSHTENED
jgi:hypothetical protein